MNVDIRPMKNIFSSQIQYHIKSLTHTHTPIESHLVSYYSWDSDTTEASSHLSLHSVLILALLSEEFCSHSLFALTSDVLIGFLSYHPCCHIHVCRFFLGFSFCFYSMGVCHPAPK